MFIYLPPYLRNWIHTWTRLTWCSLMLIVWWFVIFYCSIVMIRLIATESLVLTLTLQFVALYSLANIKGLLDMLTNFINWESTIFESSDERQADVHLVSFHLHAWNIFCCQSKTQYLDFFLWDQFWTCFFTYVKLKRVSPK